MGLLAKALEERFLSYQAIWGADLLSGRVNSAAGIPVNQANAMQLTAVFACVRLLQDTVSTLPVGIYRDVDGFAQLGQRPPWLDAPSLRDPSITWIGHIAQVMVSLLLDGNAFVFLVYDDNAEVVELVVLDPGRVVVSRNPDSSPKYRVHLDDGSFEDFDSTDIIHIPLIRMPGALRGLSPIEAARQSIGLAKVAEQYGSEFFANGSAQSGVITTALDMTKEEAEKLVEKFDMKHSGTGNRFKTGVLTAGASFTQLSITPEQAQFLGLRGYQLVDICRLYRIAPHLLQDVQPGSVSYASVEAQGIEYDTLTVWPYLEIIQSAYRRIVPGQDYLRFDSTGLTRGDIKSRYEAYSVGIDSGALLRSDARAKEGLPPIKGLDLPLVPLNLSTAEGAIQAQKADMASKLVLVGFDPEETLKAVGLPPVKHLGIPPRSLQQAQLLDPTDPTSLYLGNAPSNAPDVSPSKKVKPPAPAPLPATNGVHP